MELRARQEERLVELTVVDHGAGIEKSFLPRLFEEWTIRDPEHHGEGHGLSLALSMEIVEQHGGDLDGRSVPEVETAFTVRLPRSQ